MKLALGTAQFGLDYGINNQKGKIPEKEVLSILKYAKSKGIDTLDTAHSYGSSEILLGKYTKDFNIISKGTADEFKDSLKRLNKKKIYGYLVHDLNKFSKKEWLKLQEYKKKGNVDKIGFSVYYPKEAEKFISDYNPDIIQLPFNIFDQRFKKIIPLMKGKEVHVRSVFLQGLVFKDPKKLNNNFLKIKNKLEKLKKISNDTNIPISSLCILFATLQNFIDKIIIGIDSLKNLKENIDAFENLDKFKAIFEELKSMEENDENIILPIKWNF